MVGHQKLLYCIPILTFGIVVLTLAIVVTYIAEIMIPKAKNIDIGCVRYSRNYENEGQNLDNHISRYRSSYNDIGIDIGIEYGRARHPALQAVRSALDTNYSAHNSLWFFGSGSGSESLLYSAPSPFSPR